MSGAGLKDPRRRERSVGWWRGGALCGILRIVKPFEMASVNQKWSNA
jgi:hypothetical protein